MRNKAILFITIGIILTSLYVFRILLFRPSAPCLTDCGITDEFKDLSIKNSTKFETNGSITGIDIYFDGKIDGHGLLTIGDTDTTGYKQYNLEPDEIDIHHTTDWYTDICIVKFVPEGIANGNININCNFTGD